MARVPISRADPTPETVRNLIHGSGATGSLLGVPLFVKINYNPASSANGNMVWNNPEAGTVLAKPFVCWTTGGTGTFNMGVSSDGTGSNNNIIAAGTMIAGIRTRATTGSALLGTAGEAGGYFLIGPSGTGTNNSIVVEVSDVPTSTAVGYLLVQYVRLT